jgi:hypothetical protein
VAGRAATAPDAAALRAVGLLALELTEAGFAAAGLATIGLVANGFVTSGPAACGSSRHPVCSAWAGIARAATDRRARPCRKIAFVRGGEHIISCLPRV